MTNNTGYQIGGATSVGVTPSSDTAQNPEYWPLSRLKKAYLDYLGNKREEIDEQQQARRYRHGSQWTKDQIEVLNRRKQPVVTFNRLGRKIDGIVGLVEKMRADPKGAPRNPGDDHAAELTTAVLNYALDQQFWGDKSLDAAEFGAVDGLSGIEIDLSGPDGDRDIEIEVVDGDGFFYDPRSVRRDFSDARYMGVGKWVDAELAKEMFPDKADDIEASLNTGGDLTTDSDREQKWYGGGENTKRIRLVDCWYKHKGEWCYCIFTGSTKLIEGPSYLHDKRTKKSLCRFEMYSAAIDHDGDRYGFARNMKSAQDEINMRRSKGLHGMVTRRIIAEAGAFDDVEQARNEAARPDGIILRNPGREAAFDDAAKQQDVMNQLKMLEDAKNEIENFGPNPALIGQGIENKSGRAIKLLQEAGIAELGPYIKSFRNWKFRVYRLVWNAIQEHWTSEKVIRITEDEAAPEFLTINQVQIDPSTGQPQMVNALSQLDVDVILDEGPDQVNMMADAYDTLSLLVGQGQEIPGEVLIELSPLAGSVKRKVLGMIEQSKQQGGQAQQVGVQAEIRKTNAEAGLKEAQTLQTMQEVQLAPEKIALEQHDKAANRKIQAERNFTQQRAQQF